MNKKTKILYFSASPMDQRSLASDTEFRQIFEKLNPEYFELYSRSKAKGEELVGALAKVKPKIVHFSGHGSNKELIFEDRFEASDPVLKKDVIEVFQHLSKKPRLIFLNACWTANNLVRLSCFVDFVVATREKVVDQPAIDFATKFYELLSCGESVQSAFNSTRKHFDLKKNTQKVAMYELLVRPGAKDRPIIRDEEDTASEGNNVTEIRDTQVKGNVTIWQGNKIRR